MQRELTIFAQLIYSHELELAVALINDLFILILCLPFELDHYIFPGGAIFGS